jgi:hypothetical protein
MIGALGPDESHGKDEIRKDFFIWICCNTLKSPDSAKGIQGNPSNFPWFYLVFLAFISAHPAGGGGANELARYPLGKSSPIAR